MSKNLLEIGLADGLAEKAIIIANAEKPLPSSQTAMAARCRKNRY
jgi:hypothetical protein